MFSVLFLLHLIYGYSRRHSGYCYVTSAEIEKCLGSDGFSTVIN